jgi:hypothetical protein
MAKRTKEDLEYLASRYIKVFEKADLSLLPQGHSIVKGRPLDKRRALELAWFFMNTAVALFDKNMDEALEYYHIARGIAMSQGEVPGDILIPEPTVPYTGKKPS